MRTAGSSWELYELVARRSVAFENGWLGYGVHESFKKPQVASRWFVAGSKLARAAQQSCAKYSQASPEPSDPVFVGVVQQLIILEGQLREAAIVEGELQIGEIHSAAVNFSLADGDKDQRSMIVDLVTMTQLQHYLVRQNELFESIKARLMIAAEHA